MDDYSGPAPRHIDYPEYRPTVADSLGPGGRLGESDGPTGRRAGRATAWVLLSVVALAVVGLWLAGR